MKYRTFRKTDLAYFHERRTPINYFVDYEFLIPRTPQTLLILYIKKTKKATCKFCKIANDLIQVVIIEIKEAEP